MNRILTTALAALVAAFGTSASAQPVTADQAAWHDALRTGTVAACQEYLDAFPDGEFVTTAFRCVVTGRPPVIPPPLRQHRGVGNGDGTQQLGVDPGPYQ